MGDDGLGSPLGPTSTAGTAPPTSNSAFVICPRLQQRTASISTSNTFWLAITACCRRCSMAGDSAAWQAWKSASRDSCDSFSSSVDWASSICGGYARSAPGITFRQQGVEQWTLINCQRLWHWFEMYVRSPIGWRMSAFRSKALVSMRLNSRERFVTDTRCRPPLHNATLPMLCWRACARDGIPAGINAPLLRPPSPRSKTCWPTKALTGHTPCATTWAWGT